MADKPILFSAPMIRAMLDGRKTMTRRVMKAKPGQRLSDYTTDAGAAMDGLSRRLELPVDKLTVRFSAGDRLWTRETLRFDWPSNDWQYDADKAICVDEVGTELETPTSKRYPLGVCVSIHQPRALSRLTLLVENVKVERLQDISGDDCVAEGLSPNTGPAMGVYLEKRGEKVEAERRWQIGMRKQFHELWDSINGTGAWEENPWVAAISFKVFLANIDSMKGK